MGKLYLQLVKSRLGRSFAPVGGAGFSLIELLVVMALVGILMGLLLPAISHIRLMSMQRESSNNLANLARAAISYATDNDGLLPRAGPSEYQSYSTSQGRVLYYERAGWVNWVHPSEERAEWESGGGWRQQRDPWRSESSQADSFRRSPWWGEGARQSIREGTLWPYTSRNYAAYRCPGFSRSAHGHAPHRAVVMNDWFGTGDGRRIQHIESNHGINASRLLLFAHLNAQDQSYTGVGSSVLHPPPPGRWGRPRDDGMLDPDSEVVGVYFRDRAMVALVDGHVTTIGLEDWRDGGRSWSELTEALCDGSW